MNLYISRFKINLVFALLSAVTASTLGYVYLVWYNPEIKFWSEAISVKDQHGSSLAIQDQAKNIFVGGSSTAFQINVGLLQSEFHLPSVNYGLQYGMGLEAIVYFATRSARSGDRLVLMMEPHAFEEELSQIPNLGAQMFLANDLNSKARGFVYSKSKLRSVRTRLAATRPGLYHLATLSAKIAASHPLHRYDMDDLDSFGHITTDLRFEFNLADYASPYSISKSSKTYLAELAGWARKNNVQLIYMLPVTLVAEDVAAQQAIYNIEFGNRLSFYMPFVVDEYKGISIDIREFADTPRHMTGEASVERTRVLGKALSSWILARHAQGSE
jgi:hypothetical protein